MTLWYDGDNTGYGSNPSGSRVSPALGGGMFAEVSY